MIRTAAFDRLKSHLITKKEATQRATLRKEVLPKRDSFFYGAGVLLRCPVCALPTERLRCTPTAATRSGRSSRHRRRFPRSPDSHLRFASIGIKKYSAPDRALYFLVPVAGLEPARCRHRWILSPLRLPIPSHRQTPCIVYNTFSQIASTNHKNFPFPTSKNML